MLGLKLIHVSEKGPWWTLQYRIPPPKKKKKKKKNKQTNKQTKKNNKTTLIFNSNLMNYHLPIHLLLMYTIDLNFYRACLIALFWIE